MIIVRDIMTTKLVTVEPDDTLAHAANLFRQHQFHHLPVTRKVKVEKPQNRTYVAQPTILLCEGMLTSQDIDIAATISQGEELQMPWQERRVVEVMHAATFHVTPTTSVAAAAQLLVERGLQCLPVVEYGQAEQNSPRLVGLLTRSDLLMALSQAMGAFEPGMQLDIALPSGSIAPLARALLLAAELHVQIRSIMAAPLKSSAPLVATVRLGTINPTPLLMRLQEEGIDYSFGAPLNRSASSTEGEIHE